MWNEDGTVDHSTVQYSTVQFVRRHRSPISNICNQLFARNEDDFRSCLHNEEQLMTTLSLSHV